MKMYCLLISLFVSFITNAQVLQWNNKIGGSQNDHGYKSVIDKSGSLYVSGSFEGQNVDFDPGPGVFLMSSAGLTDGFVAKYKADGSFLWAFRVGGTSRDDMGEITLDSMENIAVTGFFRGTRIDFDPSPGEALLNSNGEAGGDPGYGGDIFVAKYDNNGKYIWAFNVGGVEIGDNGIGICTDRDNNIFVTGYFRSFADFDPSPGTMILNQSNGTLFVAKYNKDGRYQWAFNTGQGGAVDNSGFDLICDKDGNVVVTGYFQGHNIDFDPSQQVNSLTSNGSFEIFVAKYTNDGRFLWAKSAGGSGTDVGRAVTVDSQNNIYVTGDYNSSNINFNGSQTANILKNNGGNDLFLAKFSPAGQHVWSFSTGGSTNEYGMGIDRDAQNNILITGAFNGNNVDFDPSPNTISLSSNGQNDVYAVKYSADGNYLCAFSLGGANNDMGKSIVSHGPYSYVVGMFNGSNVNFNPSGITLFTSAAEDIFIAKYEWTVIPPAGSISGNLDCLTGQVTLTFNATAGTGPFTLYISNGTLTTSYRNIISGTPFTIAQNNATPTTYTLTGIKDANLCSAITPANSSAEIPAKLLQVKTSGLVTVCKGDSVEIYASGGQTYQWFPATGLSNAFSPTSKASPIVNTNYKVAVYAGANCVDTGFVTVNVREKPVVTVSPSVVMCTGDTIQLNAGGGVRYQWSPATDLNNPSISDPLVYPVNNSIFKVRVTNAEGCSDSSQVAVTITAKPKPFLGKDTSICHQATLNINATTPSAISYGWSTGEITPQITIDQPGIYTVSVGISGCILPATDTITIERKQAATISLGKDTIICDGDILALSANGSNIDGYQWSTGSTDSVININNGGLYHLTAMNSCGSVSDEIAVLTEFCADDLFFPTAFTPNNDGRNDHFRAAYLSGLKVYDYKLKIFNRWGNVVFKTSDVSQGWNGKVDGQQQMSDVFVFIASYKRSPTAPAVTKKGTMTLIR